MFEKIARTFRLGRWRHFAGYDLQGNRYFELPHPINPSSTRRVIEYRIKRDWADYQYADIPAQWSAWMRRARQEPPSIQELQSDLARMAKLQQNVAILEESYKQERAQLKAEADKVAQLDVPRDQQQQRKQASGTAGTSAPYPTQSSPSIVPTSTNQTGHPPSQEFGASIPKSTPKEGIFPGMAEDSPERQQMTAALDDAADKTMGKQEKEQQIKAGQVEPAQRGKPSTRYADAPATPLDSYGPKQKLSPSVSVGKVDSGTAEKQSKSDKMKKNERASERKAAAGDDYKPEAWKPKARRRG